MYNFDRLFDQSQQILEAEHRGAVLEADDGDRYIYSSFLQNPKGY
jgi:hypothetical protein